MYFSANNQIDGVQAKRKNAPSCKRVQRFESDWNQAPETTQKSIQRKSSQDTETRPAPAYATRDEPLSPLQKTVHLRAKPEPQSALAP
jgi:hypothetical protein